jgi:hypothetical protein
MPSIARKTLSCPRSHWVRGPLARILRYTAGIRRLLHHQAIGNGTNPAARHPSLSVEERGNASHWGDFAIYRSPSPPRGGAEVNWMGKVRVAGRTPQHGY